MAYGYRPQRPGMIDPNDPRRKRIPLTPEEDLSLGIDPSFEVDLPAATPPLAIPQLPATPAPMAARQNQPPPPADLSEFRQWYSGATQIPGMPQPEWGKRTPTYSRLNPPPPKAGTGQLPGTMKPLPAGQAPAPPSLPPVMPGMQPNAPRPSAQTMSNPAMGGQQTFFQQAQQQLSQQPTRGAGQGLGRQPVGRMQTVQGPSASPPLRPGMRQQATLGAAMQGQALAGAQGVSPLQTSGQVLNATGLQGAIQRQQQAPPSSIQPTVSPGEAIKRRALELLATTGAGGAAGALANPQGGETYRTVPQIMKDVGLELGSGLTNFGGQVMLGLQEQDQAAREMLPSIGANRRPGSMGAPVSYKDFDTAGESLLGQRTAGYQKRIEDYGKRVDRAAQEGILKEMATAVSEIVDDPSLAEQMIVTNLPNILPGLALGKIAQVANLAKGLTVAKAQQAGKLVSAGVNALMSGADARKSAFDEIKRTLMSQGMPEKQAEQEALKKSVIQGTVGAGLGAISGLGGAESAAMGSARPGILPALGRFGSEIGGELTEELTPQAITNYQLNRPVTQGLGRTAVETIVGTGPFAASAMFGGGTPKVPDALQVEQPTRSGFAGAEEKDPRAVNYENWVNAGGVRVPEAWGVQRKSRTLPGKNGLPPAGDVGQGLLNRPTPGLPPAPPRQLPPAPGQGGQPETSTGTTPTTSTAPSTRATNLSGIQFKPGWAGARPVYAMDRPIVKTALERGPGTETAMAIEPQLARLQEEFESGASMADYEERLAKFNAGKLKKVPTPPSAPTAADVRFGGTEAGQVARNLNRSSTAVLKKVAPLYGVEEGTETAFEPVMEKITAEMSSLRGKPVTLEEARGAAMLGRKAEAQGKGDTALWTDWYNQYGKAKGLDKQQFTDLRNLAAGKVGFTFRPEIQEILLGYSGQPKANEEVMEVIREDMAKQMGLPYESISLTTIPPKAWSLWAQRRQIDRLAPEAYREMMEAVERSPRSLEMQEAATSKGTPKGKKGKPVTPPVAPVTPPPVTPSVTPSVPSGTTGLAERYQSQVTRGIPGAPRSFVPGIPSQLQGSGFTRRPGNAATTGRPQGPPGIKGLLPPIGQEGQERQGAKTTRERLKARNPFTRERQAEQGRVGKAVEGRKPPTPPEAVTPTPVTPTPPPTPTPTGQTVTPATPQTLTSRTAKPVPTAETVKITAKTLNARGWNQSGNGDWGNAVGEQVVRNERNTWTHVDRSGNKTQYPTLQEAFKSIFAEPAVEKVAPSAKTTEGKAGKPARPKKEKATEVKAEPVVVPPVVEPAPATAKAIPSEVKQVLDTLDSPKGKTSRVRKLVNGEHPNIGPKAIFINDNIEQIIAEAEATGKVTKICP